MTYREQIDEYYQKHQVSPTWGKTIIKQLRRHIIKRLKTHPNAKRVYVKFNALTCPNRTMFNIANRWINHRLGCRCHLKGDQVVIDLTDKVDFTKNESFWFLATVICDVSILVVTALFSLSILKNISNYLIWQLLISMGLVIFSTLFGEISTHDSQTTIFDLSQRWHFDAIASADDFTNYFLFHWLILMLLDCAFTKYFLETFSTRNPNNIGLLILYLMVIGSLILIATHTLINVDKFNKSIE